MQLELNCHQTTRWMHSNSSQLATFAAECFWSVELVYQREPGVIETQVGQVELNHPHRPFD